MRFAVQLKGSEPLLEDVASCYQGDFARIKRVGDEWFLESSAFDACTAGLEVFPIADKILRLIHRVTAVYAKLFSPFEIGYVECFSDAGDYVNRALRTSQRVQIYSAEGINKLQERRGERSLGCALVEAAWGDKKLEEALGLIGDGEDLQWSQLYNILEFLGGADTIVKKKWATREQLIKCRQTANHYRHLGSPKQYPLPPNPPSWGVTRTLVLGILTKWISDKLVIL
jgi:hypothetical protein